MKTLNADLRDVFITSDFVEKEFYRDYRPIDIRDSSQLLSPRLDYVFKRVFGSDDSKVGELALRGLLSAVLEMPQERIQGMTLRNGEIVGDVGGDKTVRLDLLVRMEDGTKVNIEMQMHGLGLEMQARRICYYLCRLFTMEVPAGYEYEELRPAISIVITETTHFPTTDRLLHVYRMHSLDAASVELTDALEVRIVEMGKCRSKDVSPTDDRLMLWLRFFRFGEWKEVSNMLAKKDPAIAQAVERLQKISQDEHERILAFEREKTLLWDAMNRYNREQQAKRLEEKGEAVGIAKGSMETNHRNAIRMLGKGFDVDVIAECLDMSVDEIERIRDMNAAEADAEVD